MLQFESFSDFSIAKLWENLAPHDLPDRQAVAKVIEGAAKLSFELGLLHFLLLMFAVMFVV